MLHIVILSDVERYRLSTLLTGSDRDRRIWDRLNKSVLTTLPTKRLLTGLKMLLGW
jgi:hypothetical protein